MKGVFGVSTSTDACQGGVVTEGMVNKVRPVVLGLLQLHSMIAAGLLLYTTCCSYPFTPVS